MGSKNKGRKTIVLFGTFGENNTGDDILLLALIEGITSRSPDCRIVVFTGNRGQTRKLLLREKIPTESIQLVYSGRWGLFEPGIHLFRSFLWILQNFYWVGSGDILLLGPGNQLQDMTNRLRIIFFLSRAFIAYMLRTPYALVGIGMWRVRWSLSRRLLKFTANRAAFISPRDKKSAKELIALGINPSKVIPLADLSFCPLRQLLE